jgi:ABC-type lipoprotein release transport system permease subunit
MRIYLTLFSLIGLTLGIALFTIVLMTDKGMQFGDYKNALSLLLGVTSLISNAAMSYYFTKTARAQKRTSIEPKLENS